MISDITPRYMQIAEAIIKNIRSGKLTPGTRLATERNLSITYEVSRVTVRQALQVLERAGVLVRKHGSGTYVADSKIERSVQKLTPFSKTMSNKGLVPGAKVIIFKKCQPEELISTKLALSKTELAYYCERLRFLNEQPVMLEKFYLPVKSFPDLEQIDLNNCSIYETLQAQYSLEIKGITQTLEAVGVNSKEAKLLKCKVGTPGLLEHRVAYDQNNKPVEVAFDLYLGDRFRFITQEYQT